VNDIVKLVRGLTRPLVVLMVVAAVIGLAFMQVDVPEPLKTIAASVVGYWFGTHSLAKDG